MPEEWNQLLDAIDELTARAQTAADKGKRIEYLSEALFKACRYVKGLNRRIPEVIEKVLMNGRFDPERLTLSLSDIAFSDDQLEVFRSKQSLAEFLLGIKPLLLVQMPLTEEQVTTFSRHIEQTYNLFITESIEPEALLSRFKRLEDYFCCPPEGPGGPIAGNNPKDQGPGGASSDRIRQVIGYVTAFANLAGVLWKVAEQILRSQSEKGEVPFQLQLLTIVSMVGFVGGLEQTEEIPEREMDEAKFQMASA